MHKYIATFAVSIISALTFGSCQSKSEESGKGRVIHVDIEPQDVAVEDLFDRIEVVPLETTDSALIVGISQLEEFGNDMFIMDSRTMCVYRFDKKGRFVNKIGSTGNGPGEYVNAYGFDVGRSTGDIYIVSARGMVYQYDSSGQFIASYTLPERANYWQLHRMPDGNWATWTHCYLDELPITILDKDFSTVLNVPDLPLHMANRCYSDGRFFRQDDRQYVGFDYDRNIYELRNDTAYISYTWDFGDDNLNEEALEKHDIDPYSASDETNRSRNRTFHEDTSIKNYIFYHGASRRYAIVYVSFLVERDPVTRKPLTKPKAFRVFHDKESGKNYVFDSFVEGFTTAPFYVVNDEYAICKIYPEDLHLYEAYLPEGMKLSDIDPDDDNPVLARFYFKK